MIELPKVVTIRDIAALVGEPNMDSILEIAKFLGRSGYVVGTLDWTQVRMPLFSQAEAEIIQQFIENGRRIPDNFQIIEKDTGRYYKYAELSEMWKVEVSTISKTAKDLGRYSSISAKVDWFDTRSPLIPEADIGKIKNALPPK